MEPSNEHRCRPSTQLFDASANRLCSELAAKPVVVIAEEFLGTVAATMVGQSIIIECSRRRRCACQLGQSLCH